MPQLPRLNLKLTLAAICFIAGTVILWRTFLRPPGEDTAALTPPPAAEATAVLTAETTDPADTAEPSPTEASVAAEPTAPAPEQGGYPAPPAQEPPTPTVTPTALLPTAAVVAPPPATSPPAATTATGAATATTAATAVPTTAAPATATSAATAAPTSAATAAPTSAATAAPTTAAPTATTVIPTTIATATTGPTATPTPTPTPTPTDTSLSGALVVYRLEGQATLVIVSYIDAAGNNKEVEVSLPWTIQFSASAEADLAVDAYSNIEESVPLSCTIQVNGVVVSSQQTQNAVDGVSCERFAQ